MRGVEEYKDTYMHAPLGGSALFIGSRNAWPCMASIAMHHACMAPRIIARSNQPHTSPVPSAYLVSLEHRLLNRLPMRVLSSPTRSRASAVLAKLGGSAFPAMARISSRWAASAVSKAGRKCSGRIAAKGGRPNGSAAAQSASSGFTTQSMSEADTMVVECGSEALFLVGCSCAQISWVLQRLGNKLDCNRPRKHSALRIVFPPKPGDVVGESVRLDLRGRSKFRAVQGWTRGTRGRGAQFRGRGTGSSEGEGPAVQREFRQMGLQT